MGYRIITIIIFFGWLSATSLTAQEVLPANWNAEKIKGARFIAYPGYSGLPYLTDNFVNGEIELLDGTKIENIGLRYSTYRDEIIYYNTNISSQIIIDKMNVKGFTLIMGNGTKRVFHRQYFNGYMPGERFFEVLSDGKISLLVYRKVDLETCDPSYSKLGLAYQSFNYYYIYSPEKGYSQMKINRNSLLSKFQKTDQKLVKKLLRKNNIMIIDEASLVKAWNLVREKEIAVNFNE